MNSSSQCSWCDQHYSNSDNSSTFCSHRICSFCHIRSDISPPSSCPCCCYESAKEFIQTKEICSVCLRETKNFLPTKQCSNQHRFCSQCLEHGCNLCRFLELRSQSKRSSNDQRVIETCSVWAKIFHLQKYSHLRGSTDQESSSMEIDERVDSSNPPKKDEEQCAICFETMTSSDLPFPICQHRFHQSCLDQWFTSSGKKSCPTCGKVYQITTGPQPASGTMKVNFISTRLPGFESSTDPLMNPPTIEITYSIPSGIQTAQNPHPGQPFFGTTRIAYLPNNKEGNEILNLLRRAFDHRHVFTVGRSTMTGVENTVTWNDIHHKTSITGGPESFGYPDPTYLRRVREELAQKGFQ